MSKWIPDRKVWSGGLAMVLAWLIVEVLNRYAGANIPIEVTAGLAFGIGKAVEYFVPQPAKELMEKINDGLVAAAGASPDSPVSQSVGQAATKAVVEKALGPAGDMIGRIAVSEFDALIARIGLGGR